MPISDQAAFMRCGHPAHWLVIWPAPPRSMFAMCECHQASGIGPALARRLFKERRFEGDGRWRFRLIDPYRQEIYTVEFNAGRPE